METFQGMVSGLEKTCVNLAVLVPSCLGWNTSRSLLRNKMCQIQCSTKEANIPKRYGHHPLLKGPPPSSEVAHHPTNNEVDSQTNEQYLSPVLTALLGKFQCLAVAGDVPREIDISSPEPHLREEDDIPMTQKDPITPLHEKRRDFKALGGLLAYVV